MSTDIQPLVWYTYPEHHPPEDAKNVVWWEPGYACETDYPDDVLAEAKTWTHFMVLPLPEGSEEMKPSPTVWHPKFGQCTADRRGDLRNRIGLWVADAGTWEDQVTGEEEYIQSLHDDANFRIMVSLALGSQEARDEFSQRIPEEDRRRAHELCVDLIQFLIKANEGPEEEKDLFFDMVKEHSHLVEKEVHRYQEWLTRNWDWVMERKYP